MKFYLLVRGAGILALTLNPKYFREKNVCAPYDGASLSFVLMAFGFSSVSGSSKTYKPGFNPFSWGHVSGRTHSSQQHGVF